MGIVKTLVTFTFVSWKKNDIVALPWFSTSFAVVCCQTLISLLRRASAIGLQWTRASKTFATSHSQSVTWQKTVYLCKIMDVDINIRNRRLLQRAHCNFLRAKSHQTTLQRTAFSPSVVLRLSHTVRVRMDGRLEGIITTQGTALVWTRWQEYIDYCDGIASERQRQHGCIGLFKLLYRSRIDKRLYLAGTPLLVWHLQH